MTLNPRVEERLKLQRKDTPCCGKPIYDLEQVTALLKAVLPTVEQYAYEPGYGNPVCDDPRDFSPDPECCTPEEIARWKEACERAERGEAVKVPRHEWVQAKDGSVWHVSHNPWGIGIYIYRHPVFSEVLSKLKEAVKILEGYGRDE